MRLYLSEGFYKIGPVVNVLKSYYIVAKKTKRVE